MTLVTILWPMIAAVCLTLAFMHLIAWLEQRDAWANLAFFAFAASTAWFAAFELLLMRAETPEQFGHWLRWFHVPAFVAALAIMGFIRLYLKAGRLWLAWAIVTTRIVVLALDFMLVPNFNFREISAMRPVRFLGDSVFLAVGVRNPWAVLGNLSWGLLLVFVADAALTAWRRGARRQAVVVGGSVMFFVTAGVGEMVLSTWGIVPWPIFASVFFLGVVVAMGYELSRDLRRASFLSRDLLKSESELRESETLLSLAADAANAGLWSLDENTGRFWTTAKMLEMFGLASGSELDLQRFLNLVHPEDRQRVRQAIAQAERSGDEMHIEYRAVYPDGAVRWFSSRGRNRAHKKGDSDLLRGITVDITNRKQAELEMLELRQGLAHASRVTMVGQLAAATAHELNQPLGAILRNAEAAEMMLRSSSPDLDELRAIVADIHADDRRAGEVIDRLRSLLKNRQFESHVLSMAKLVEEVMALVRTDALARGVTVETQVPVDLPWVRGDRVHLQQVLLNLFLNGMDAVQDRPAGERHVTISASLNAKHMIEVRVSDTGGGIPPENLTRMFELFFTTKPSGMGIGLAVSRTIIVAHGGLLWAENNPERGATVCFTVPVAAEGEDS